MVDNGKMMIDNYFEETTIRIWWFPQIAASSMVDDNFYYGLWQFVGIKMMIHYGLMGVPQ